MICFPIVNRTLFPTSNRLIIVSSFLELQIFKKGLFHVVTGNSQNQATTTAIPEPSLDDSDPSSISALQRQISSEGLTNLFVIICSNLLF